MGIIVNAMCVQPGYVKERLERWMLGQGARIEHGDVYNNKCITMSLFIMWNLGLHVCTCTSTSGSGGGFS